jgi:hypothetical protein
MATKKFVLEFRKISSQDAERVGGKNAALGEMISRAQKERRASARRFRHDRRCFPTFRARKQDRQKDSGGNSAIERVRSRWPALVKLCARFFLDRLARVAESYPRNRRVERSGIDRGGDRADRSIR